MKKRYSIYYNAAVIAVFATLKGVKNYISRKNLRDDENNLLDIYDSETGEYFKL